MIKIMNDIDIFVFDLINNFKTIIFNRFLIKEKKIEKLTRLTILNNFR
jgi:hypothetical protein